MSSGARIAVVVAAVIVLGLAFVLLSPEADDDANVASTPTTTAPAATPNETATTEGPTAAPQPPPAAPQPPPAADHEPAFERVHVRAGKPVGGVQTITVDAGERARIEVTSTDTTDEVHLHGYDITRDLKPGRSARFSFATDAEGIFEVELHGAGTPIAEVVVKPG